MKKALSVLALTLSACASAPPADVHPVGQSQQAPKAVAQCIAVTWANASNQTVYTQYVLANDTAFDVYAPGQQAPSGSAAMVRPSFSGAATAVSFRGSDSNAASSISPCL